MTTLARDGVILFDDRPTVPNKGRDPIVHLPVSPEARAAAHALAARSTELTRTCAMAVTTPAVLERAVRQAEAAELEARTLRTQLGAQLEAWRLEQARAVAEKGVRS